MGFGHSFCEISTLGFHAQGSCRNGNFLDFAVFKMKNDCRVPEILLKQKGIYLVSEGSSETFPDFLKDVFSSIWSSIKHFQFRGNNCPKYLNEPFSSLWIIFVYFSGRNFPNFLYDFLAKKFVSWGKCCISWMNMSNGFLDVRLVLYSFHSLCRKLSNNWRKLRQYPKKKLNHLMETSLFI